MCTAIAENESQCQGPLDKAILNENREQLLATADGILIGYPNAKYRDWVEMFLVVLTLVLAFRTFFFQPFKIPTGSMQPTLFGITALDMNEREGQGEASENNLVLDYAFFDSTDAGRRIEFADGTKATIQEVISKSNALISTGITITNQSFKVLSEQAPNWRGRITDKLRGFTYYQLKAEGNWQLRAVNPPKTLAPLITKQTLEFTNESGKTIEKTIWFPPIRGTTPMLQMPRPKFTGQYAQAPNEFEAIKNTSFNKGDYQTAHLILFALSHPIITNLSYKLQKWAPATIKEIRLFFGGPTYSRHVEFWKTYHEMLLLRELFHFLSFLPK